MINDDDFLSQHREAPRPEFARELYDRIDGRAEAAAPDGERRSGLRPAWRSAVAASVAAAAAVGLLAFPGVRAAAQDFLDMFRVKKFVAVPISPERVAQLQSGRVDVESILGDSVEVIQKAGPPRVVASAEDAGRDAGIPVLVPTYVFNLNEAPEIRVLDARAARFTANASRLQAVADTLGIDDVRIPQQLDGATVTVRVPAAVTMRYQRGGVWVASFTQGRSPEIDLPSGVDLAQLGEIGLRVTGMSADEAHEFASRVDWTSTLLVPVPANASTFREVDVHGTTGLLVSLEGPPPGQSRDGEKGDAARNMLLWTENGMVYALSGNMNSIDLIQMANSLRNG